MAKLPYTFTIVPPNDPPEPKFTASCGEIVEFDYEILDIRGKRAAWLESKLTDKIRSEIEQQIAEVV